MFSEPDNYIPAPTTLLRTKYKIGEYGKNHKKIRFVITHIVPCVFVFEILLEDNIMRYCLLFIMVDCDLMVDKINSADVIGLFACTIIFLFKDSCSAYMNKAVLVN